MSKFADYARSPRGRARRAPPETLDVREPRGADLDALAAIAAEREGEPEAHWHEAFARMYAACHAADRLLLVAEVSGVVVGYGKAAVYTPPANAPQNAAPGGWYLTGVVVHSAHRRIGIGSALTSARLTRIAGYSSLVYYFANVRNRASIDLHAKLGFAEVTRDFWHPEARFEGGVGALFRCRLDDARGRASP